MKKQLLILAVFLIWGPANVVDACTTFIISGRYTPDGRPVLYKHRDTGVTDNALAVFSDGKYNYTGLLNSDKSWNTELWGGFNSAGFAIMNSAAYNKNIGDTTSLVDQEGKIMKLALQNCATIDDFEKLLTDLPGPLGVDSNFGVIDAFGGAAYFETGNFTFEKIDANDPAAAPYGYLIRTNHAFTGPVDQGYGYIRYSTANEALYRAVAINRYDPQYLISNISRNLYHSLTGVNLRDELPEDSSREKFVYFEDFIPRYSSASAICVVGAKAGEDPSSTVMWTLCGFPLTTAAVPVWLTKDKTLPAAVSMKSDLHSPLCDAALMLKDKCFPVKRGSGSKYLNLTALANQRNTGILQLVERFEEEIFKKADELTRTSPGGKPDDKRITDFYKWLDDYITVSYRSLLRAETAHKQELPPEFLDPPREFSVMPFWFWNDTLKDEEIIRQIADFESHGVYGFVIHPRVGLPQNVKWLGPEMIRAMNVAISEAARRNMYVILYDEGMYPSGSSSGQVVEKNPGHAARGLAKIDLKEGEELRLEEGWKLITVANRPGNSRAAIIERPSGGLIRGLHYLNEGEERLREHSPPAGDLLNPDAVKSFISLVYDKYAREFGKYFGNTIMGIFTDEPSPLGRDAVRGMVPGNASLLPRIKKILGYDITPHLADLWYNDHPDSKRHRNDYHRAINICLEEIYYKRLGNWCFLHNISLMGHPAGSMDIGTQRYFQIPGQDLVWRYVEPGPKALEGQHSTMAKGASAAMIHNGYRRNSNELYGAYGHDLTWEEMLWLANWCFVRGHNLLIPHAFFYSVRGPRIDERPPDVGPNAAWWPDYKPYADACRRLSWLNTDSRHICDVAILCEATWLPDRAAKVLYRNQRDFNYLEIRHLREDAKTDSRGIHIGDMLYRALIVDSLSHIPPRVLPKLKKLAKHKHLILRNDSKLASVCNGALVYGSPGELMAAVSKITSPDIVLNPPSENIRFRHVEKDGDHYFMLFNEENSEVRTNISLEIEDSKPYTGQTREWIDPFSADTNIPETNETIYFRPYEMKLLRIAGKK